MSISEIAKKKIEQLKKGNLSPLEFAKFLSDPIVIVENPNSQFYGRPMVNNDVLSEIIKLINTKWNDPELSLKLEEIKKLFWEKKVKHPVNSVNVTESNATAICIILSI